MAAENDIVLIYMEDTPVSFARVETIRADVKKNWFQITLLMLQIPLQVITWILKDDYINGDVFYMDGKKMRLEKVVCPEQDQIPPEVPFSNSNSTEKTKDEQSKDQDAEIISFADVKKARQKKQETS